MLTPSHLKQIVSSNSVSLIEQQPHVAVPEAQQPDEIFAAGVIRSPKRRVHAAESRANWFRYYAGFSVGFVEDIISHLDLADGAILLDPWLGAGTTAEVATGKGFQLRGFDLNPAMLLVARARTVPTGVADQIPVLTKCISRSYEGRIRNGAMCLRRENEPLEQWLQPGSAAAFRTLEQLIETSVLKQEPSSVTPLWRRAGQAQPLFTIETVPPLPLFPVPLLLAMAAATRRFNAHAVTWQQSPTPF